MLAVVVVVMAAAAAAVALRTAPVGVAVVVVSGNDISSRRCGRGGGCGRSGAHSNCRANGSSSGDCCCFIARSKHCEALEDSVGCCGWYYFDCDKQQRLYLVGLML